MINHILHIENRKISQIPYYFFDLKPCEFVTTLYLKFSNLQTLRNSDLNQFSKVTYLTLLCVNLIEIGPQCFQSMAQMKFLHFEAESIKWIPKELFIKLYMLESLVLIVPNVENFFKYQFKDNKLLRSLKMVISCSLNVCVIGHLYRLESLDLQMTNINEMFGDFDFIQNLKMIRLSNLRLHGENFEHLLQLSRAYFNRFNCLHRLQWFLSGNRMLTTIIIRNSANQLDMYLYKILSQSKSLTYLNLSKNAITSIAQYIFRHCCQLRNLNLNENLLYRLKSNFFYGLCNLTSLDLSHNNIKSVNPFAFRHLPTLQFLNLGNNSLYNSPLMIMFWLTKMKQAHFCYNNIKSFNTLLNSFSSYPDLVLLNFQFNFITSIKTNLFSIAKHLKKIYLNYNSIQYLSSNCFQNLAVLEYLDLSYNLIQTLMPAHFYSLKSLQTLKLSHNVIDKISAELFQNLDNLRILDLSFNCISKLPPKLFMNNRNLTHLMLNDNSLTELLDDIFLYSPLSFIQLVGNQFEYVASLVFTNFIIPYNCLIVVDKQLMYTCKNSEQWCARKIVIDD